MSTRPTIADVARRAHVSRTAVSFAINGRVGVAEETRARILRAAEELGWQPSMPARALSQARAGAVGLVLIREADDLDADDFFVRFLAGVERTLARRDYALVLQVLPPGARERLDGYRRLLSSGRVDGMLLADLQLEDDRFDPLVESGLPAVVAGRPLRECPFPTVDIDDADGMTAVVEHLIALGHRSVAFIGGDPSYESVARRRHAWIDAMRSNGLEPGLSASAVPEDPAAREATARMLEAAQPPTAIVYARDSLALAGLGVARKLRVDVPGDVSIAGFDDSPVAALSSPTLTTVHVDYTGLGQAAAETLLAELDGDAPSRVGPAPTEVMVRASTGPPALTARPR